MSLILSVLPDRLAICRLPADAPVPAPPAVSGLWNITRTKDELSLVLPQEEAKRRRIVWRPADPDSRQSGPL